eukprot:TRINITY_DN34201_c0_g1_i1.p1 TRINITY_DN34201_c0_g1~~TRINITY_DN34201_c0_g1_i1.p1  ORF type:complete len:459 (+),score=103.59 TRINITY_DN34201_c0_g1_i1:66-1442(+)
MVLPKKKQDARGKKRKAAPRVAGFPSITPKAAGLDPQPLQAFQRALRRETCDLKSLPGSAHIVLRNGRCAFAAASGQANLKTGTKFQLDTICALHGATKPIVVAAFLTLVDEKKVRLNDPVAKYIRFPDTVAIKLPPKSKKPGQRTRRVVRKARRAPTLRHLLANVVGMTESPALRRVRKGAVKDLAGLCDALADAPLSAEPGTQYDYGMALDVLGRVCEAVTGDSLDALLQKRLFTPLGMKDSHFVVPSAKRHRVAPLYDAWQLKGGAWRMGLWKHPEAAPGIMSSSGGILSYRDAGLYSTLQDYARFLQMLMDDGKALSGVRILKAATVKSLWVDGLAPYANSAGKVKGWHDSPEPEWAEQPEGFWGRTGWSLLNTHLVFDQKPRRSPPRRSSYMWMGGGGGAYWVADKKSNLVAVSFTQCFGGRTDPEDGHGPLARDVTPSAFAACGIAKRRKLG